MTRQWSRTLGLGLLRHPPPLKSGGLFSMCSSHDLGGTFIRQGGAGTRTMLAQEIVTLYAFSTLANMYRKEGIASGLTSGIWQTE